jgi:hypothetical protein
MKERERRWVDPQQRVPHGWTTNALLAMARNFRVERVRGIEPPLSAWELPSRLGSHLTNLALRQVGPHPVAR